MKTKAYFKIKKFLDDKKKKEERDRKHGEKLVKARDEKMKSFKEATDLSDRDFKKDLAAVKQIHQ